MKVSDSSLDNQDNTMPPEEKSSVRTKPGAKAKLTECRIWTESQRKSDSKKNFNKRSKDSVIGRNKSNDTVNPTFRDQNYRVPVASSKTTRKSPVKKFR